MLHNFLKRPLSLIYLLLVVFFFPFFASAEESAMNYFVDGIEAFDTASYEDAIQAFEKSITMEPENLEFQYYLGLTYEAMGKNEEALKIFESIIKSKPDESLNPYFQISAIHIKHKDYRKAIDILNVAEKMIPDDPQVYMEKGLAYRETGDYDAAIRSFNKAKDIDPVLSQAACYNIAAVYFAKEDYEQSEELFRKAIELNPDSGAALNAKQSIENIKKAKAIHQKLWSFSSTLAWGYDSNVPLDPLSSVVQRPGDQPTGKTDQFQIFYLDGSYKIINDKNMEAGLGYRLRSVGYKSWVQNNLFGHLPYAYFQYNTDTVRFRLMYEFSTWHEGGEEKAHDWLYLAFGQDSDKSLEMQTFKSNFTILESHNLKSDIVFEYQVKNYYDGFTSDARRYSGEIIQSYNIPDTEIYPRIGYKYVYDDADDDKQTYRYHIAQAGLFFPVFWDIRADLSFIFGRINFEHNPNYSATGERSDTQYRFAGSLTRQLSKHFHLTFYYDYSHNNSDISSAGDDPYKFRKNISTFLLTYIY